MEKNEASFNNGDGNSYTTEFRQYDSRLGRWLSLDPLMSNFPWQSPYCAFDNNPVFFTDRLGLSTQGDYFDKKTGKKLGTDGVDDGKVFTISSEKWNALQKVKYYTEGQALQNLAISYGARQSDPYEADLYTSGAKERQYNASQKSKEMVRPENVAKKPSVWDAPKSKPEKPIDPVLGPKNPNNSFPATDFTKSSAIENASTIVGNTSFVISTISSYKASKVLPKSPISFYTYGTALPGVSQNYRLGKIYSNTSIKGINALNTSANVFGFYSMVTSNFKLARNAMDGNPNTQNTVRNYTDGFFGIAGGVGVLYCTTPVGWACAIGSGVYGLGTLMYDVYQTGNNKKNGIGVDPNTNFYYFHGIDNTAVRNIYFAKP
jgi:RHS repeat-associated protein